MDIQDLYRFCYHVAFLAGIAGGCLAYRFRPSGKWALAMALVPLVVGMARAAAITVAPWCDSPGLRDLFCCGHPVSWLGQSLTVITCPLAFGLAIPAVWNGVNRWFAFPALALSGLEMYGIWIRAAMAILGLGDPGTP